MEIFTQVFTEVNAFFPLRETPRGHFKSSKYTIYQLIWCKQLYLNLYLYLPRHTEMPGLDWIWDLGIEVGLDNCSPANLDKFWVFSLYCDKALRQSQRFWCEPESSDSLRTVNNQHDIKNKAG